MNISLTHHRELKPERWFKFTTLFQMANVGAEIDRTIRAKMSKDPLDGQYAFERMLELLTLTILDPKNRGCRRRELCRTRELLIDHFCFDNTYNTTDETWHNYFFQFSYAAALERERRYINNAAEK